MLNVKFYSLRSILEKEKLASNGTNFVSWYRFLRFVLKEEKLEYVISQIFPQPSHNSTAQQQKDFYRKFFDDEADVGTLILASLDPELQREFVGAGYDSYTLVYLLKKRFLEQEDMDSLDFVRVMEYVITRELLMCKKTHEVPMSSHAKRLESYFRELENIGSPMPTPRAVDIVMNSLPGYEGYLETFHVFGRSGGINEVLRVLDEYFTTSWYGEVDEDDLESSDETLDSLKEKRVWQDTGRCFHCHKYLADKKAGNNPSSSRIFCHWNRSRYLQFELVV